MHAGIHRRTGRGRRMIDALPVRLGLAPQLVRRRDVRRLGVIPVARIGHGQRAGGVVVVDGVLVAVLLSTGAAVVVVPVVV